MVVDYSKWDAIEVSDDSDVDVHPNVDKKSFIRAKQAQIHLERDQRKHRILTLKHERKINDGLLLRIGRLLTALKSHRDTSRSSSADELVFQALIESAGDPKEDAQPEPPEGVYTQVKDKPTYTKMLAVIVDEAKQEVDKSKAEDRYEGFIKEIGKEQSKIDNLQRQLLAKLAELEKEQNKHITSDDIHDGFNYSSVVHDNSKASGSTADSTSTKPTKSTKSTKSKETVELLNAPGRPVFDRTDTGQSSGADADVEDATDDKYDPNNPKLSEEGDKYVEIPIGDWGQCRKFMLDRDRKMAWVVVELGSKEVPAFLPSVMGDRDKDSLMAEAFNSELDGKHKYSQQCVHRSLLLQYARTMAADFQENHGRDWREGVYLFFERMMKGHHQSYTVFTNDVRSTYTHIRNRVTELLSQREGVEQIQLQAKDDGTEPNITIPPPLAILTDPSHPQFPKDVEQQIIDGTIEARKVFESFPPGLQRALETGKLDEINKVLAKIAVDEAEAIVSQMSATGILSIEGEVIDATTEEGQKKLKDIESNAKHVSHDGQENVMEDLGDEPGPALEDTVG